MIEFKMPALGADMESGTLVEWLVKPGDDVVSGSIVAVVETQKGAIEVETFNKGRIADILVAVGQRVPVGAVLAHIDDGKGATATPSSAPPAAPVPVSELSVAAPPAITPPLSPTSRRAHSAGRIMATPVARRRAAELSVDLSRVSGTGFHGSIRLADIEAFRPAETPLQKRAGFDAAEMRKAIAAAMSRAKREIPHYYLADTLDMSRALAWLEEFNAKQPPAGRLLPAVLLLKASALALRRAPELNGTFVDGAFVPGKGIHIGWAVSLRGGGLIAPAIRDVDRMPLAEAMAAMRDVVQRARSGGLRSSELSSATITITSLGDRGAEAVQAIIYPPQVAIVGFGRLATKPWVTNERIEARPLVTATLAADHRVTDGHKGGLFLEALRDILQEPEAL
jgi:pyruvate dehydrogenase E2 component (dihydrolipoamide acetyltransferase)